MGGGSNSSSSSSSNSKSTSSTKYGTTTTTNPYVTSTTDNSGTTTTLNDGTALSTVYNYVNSNIGDLLDEYLNPSLDSSTNQALLDSYTKTLNESARTSLENDIIAPLSSRNMLRSSQATDLYNNLSNSLTDSISDYASSLLESSQSNTADVKNNPAGEKRQFNARTKDGLNIRIPHDTILHEQKKHKLTADEWQTLLDNIDNVSNAVVSKRKSKYVGKSVLLKIKAGDKTYGVVLETFPKNNPLISTAFIDNEKNIDNWIKNEAIPNGTKTTFLDTHPNDIIAHVQPDYKPFNVNDKSGLYFQAADTAGAGNNEVEQAEKEWQEKGVLSRFFKKWFGKSKVVDENGKPLIVYHGTTSVFDIFNSNNPSTDLDFPNGIYFSSSREIAET